MYQGAIINLATDLRRHLPSRYRLEHEDLIQEGYVGALKAFHARKNEFKISYWGYAKWRTLGSMKDYIFNTDHLSQQQRKFNVASIAVDRWYLLTHQRPPSGTEIANCLDLGYEDYLHLRADVDLRQADVMPAPPDMTREYIFPEGREEPADPATAVEQKQEIEVLHRALAQLSTQKRLLLVRHYLQGETLEEIGKEEFGKKRDYQAVYITMYKRRSAALQELRRFMQKETRKKRKK